MSLQHLGRGTLRVVKNYTKGYSDTQAKVRDATSNDPWGPSGTQMNEIAQMTYNQNDFVEIMEMLDKRLNDKGKNWRHVFKALTVLDYCLHAGSENVVIYFRDNIYIIKTLKEFQFVDEYGKDQGANVRQKAKDITNLLQDEARLREERRSRAHMRDRMVGRENGGDEEFGSREPPIGGSGSTRRRGGDPADDDELKKAMLESKRTFQEEQARKVEEDDFQKALRLSEEEEAKRKAALEDANARSLFDDAQQNTGPVSTNPFPLVDTTGVVNGGLQPQYLQPQFTQLQPQFTSFNPYTQLQLQQEALQAQAQQEEWLRQQQLLLQQQQQQQFAQAQQDEWSRQQQLLLQQQQQQQLQQQLQQQYLQQQQQQQEQLLNRANNPFAPAIFSSPAPPSISPSPAPTPSSFTSSAPAPAPSPARKREDGQHAHLAHLLANRDDGQDTFGNTGLLRYGHTQAGIQAQRTGYNPFTQQQQQQYQQSGNNDQPFFSI